MPKTSSAVKNRYNKKAYDDVRLVIKKGEKAVLQEYAKSRGESLNGFIRRAIEETIERDKLS